MWDSLTGCLYHSKKRQDESSVLEVQILVSLEIKEGVKIRPARKVISGSFLLLMYMLSICYLPRFVLCLNEKLIKGTSLVAQLINNPPAIQETCV